MASMQRTNHFRWGNLDDHTCPEASAQPTSQQSDRSGPSSMTLVSTLPFVQQRISTWNDLMGTLVSCVLLYAGGRNAHPDVLFVASYSKVVKRKKQRHQEIQFGVFMVCRLCRMRGDHWTSRCPQRDPSYVPISMRAGADRRNTASSDMRRNSLRVTNLSEDTREQDVMEWFSAYGYDNNLILRG